MNPKNKILTSRLSKSVALSATLMALGTSASFAAITIAQTTAFPASPDLTVVETPIISGGVTVSDNRQVTQTFQVATGFTIDKFYINTTSLTASQTFSISIFTVADTNAGASNAIPTGGSNLLTTITVTTPASGSGSVLEFDLTGADEIFLAATTGTAGYALQFNRGVGETGAFVWQLNQAGDGTGGGTVGTDQYAAGQAYATVLGTGFTHGNSDLTLAFVAVPEPSTGLMAMLASSVLFLRRRRA